MDNLIADFHIHSKYSHDSLMSPESIVKRAKNVGLTCIAITDHETIRGGVEGKKFGKKYGVEVIIGAEIKSDCGDIIGLYLNKEIQSVKLQDVIQDIRAQGGIVVLPHPYRDHREPEKIAQYVDFIEIWNSRCSLDENKKAALLASDLKKKCLYGSDAHCLSEIGLVKIKVKQNSFEFLEIIGSNYCHQWAIQQSQIIHHIKKREFVRLITEGARFLWKKII